MEALHEMQNKLKDKKAVLRLLGIVNFNRRFIRRLGHIASPLYNLLKNDVREDDWPLGELENGCPYAKAYKETIDALSSDVKVAHSDLHDPLAEYVIMTDASDVAAGAVLVQWQCGPMYNNEDQPAEPPIPTADTFARCTRRAEPQLTSE
eukprot:3026021-Pleurochrysis_carterae.AAC.7